MDLKGDMYTIGIEFAIKNALESFDDSEYGQIAKETLKRDAKIWEAIQIHGLNMIGKTYEDFCEEVDKHNNILFLTDDELKLYRDHKELIELLKPVKEMIK